MKTAYIKSTGRLFLKHILRLISVALVFIVTVSLDSGFCEIKPHIKECVNATYTQENVHDFTIRGDYSSISTKIEPALENNPEFFEINPNTELFYTFDMRDENDKSFAKRATFRDFSNMDIAIDKLELIDGRYPEADDEIVVERETKEIKGHKVGDIIDSIKVYPAVSDSIYNTFTNLKVVGIVENPVYLAERLERSDYVDPDDPENFNVDNGRINDVFYFSRSIMDKATVITDPCFALKLVGAALNVQLSNRKIFDSFSDDYKDKISTIKDKIQTIDIASGLSIAVLTLYDMYSLYSLDGYANKVGQIATIFIVFFILVAVLVIYSTMSRLLDEERSSMAVLKTMGYSNFAVSVRYILFTLIAGIIGIIASIFPAKFVTDVIVNAFHIQYDIKEIAHPLIGFYFFILATSILVISVILVMIKSIRLSHQKPVDLLTHKTPNVGRKIWLERIKPLWKRLSFRMKSTWRNVFLFKSRFLMTVLSIIGSTMLIFASFCLLDCTIANLDKNVDSLFAISLVLVAFSGALCALVVYNLTNINISERTREVATLMVCGYHTREVTGYIYREIYILTIIGAILGIPAGYGFMFFVFDYIGAKPLLSYEHVNWWTFIVAPIVTCLFAVVATLLLRPKIVKIDMNESLKVLE